MSRKKRIVMGVSVVAAVAIGIGAVLKTVADLSPTRPAPARAAVLKAICRDVASYHKGHYGHAEGDLQENRDAQFLAYLERQGAPYACEPTPQPRRPEDNLGIYLLLPAAIETDRPALIAYTDPVTAQDGSRHRGAIFVRDAGLVPLVMAAHTLVQIVGEKQIEMAKPSLYLVTGSRRVR